MAKVKSTILDWPSAPDYSAAINQKIADSYFRYHSPYTYKPVRYKYNVIGDTVERCETVTVYEFRVDGYSDDPDLVVAEPLIEWERSDKGQWVMRNAADVPTWHRVADIVTYGYKYAIRAKFMGPALTEWLLRYGSK